MRILLLLALLPTLLSGCIAEPGLGSSPTRCPDSEPVTDGFLVTINGTATTFVGYCMELSDRDADVDDVIALRKVPASGDVYLPVDHAASYYITVSVEEPNDKYCATHIGEIVDHPGTGIVEVLAEPAGICA